ncbi:MAG TPA: hypothetical protein V6D46_05810, partial [Coleofasciculaceae cyanobacterium]
HQASSRRQKRSRQKLESFRFHSQSLHSVGNELFKFDGWFVSLCTGSNPNSSNYKKAINNR